MVAARTQLQEFTVMHRLEVRIPGLNWPRNARRFPIRRLQPERANPRVGQNNRSKSACSNFSVSDLESSSLAGYFRLIRSNLCTRA